MERSDAMQRNTHCVETRSNGRGPWDGFSDFSAFSIYRHLVGATEIMTGTVPYNRTGEAPFHMPKMDGYPTLRFDANDNRVLIRDHVTLEQRDWEKLPFLIPQEWNVPVYTVYGSYHPEYKEANILYKPLEYEGNLPALIDPTDEQTFEKLKKIPDGPYEWFFYWEKDLTFKFIYEDDSVRHAIYPYGNVSRDWTLGSGPWRYDMLYFAITIPRDNRLKRVELYFRPFVSRYPDDTIEGNINDSDQMIRASNFMDGATLIKAMDLE